MSGWKLTGFGIAIGLVALGMAPLTTVYFHNLWSRPHYQFFPVLIAAVAMLLISRWRGHQVEAAAGSSLAEMGTEPPASVWSRLKPLLSLLLVGLGMGIESIALHAFLVPSPWGGYLGLLVAGLGVVMYLSDGRVISLIPAWLLMALLLMPPENRDSQLITFLQQRTATFTSQLLDLAGVDHIREGVMIEIPSRKLFVEETCSGVQSLFSLLAVAAVLAVWHSRSIVHTLLLMAAAIAGAGAMNVLRTVSIVYGLERVGVDLLAEPQHSILGAAVFVVALAWLICCDAFLVFVTAPIDTPDSEVTDNAWVAAWNRLIAGFRWRDMPAQPAPRRRVDRLVCRAVLMVLAVGGALLAVDSSRAVIASQQPGANPLFAPVHEGKVLGTLGLLVEDSLPEQFEGWKRVRFEAVERKESNAFGEHSKVWIYSTPFGPASISVDYPFRSWHDLRVCYQGAGWFPSEAEASSSTAGRGVVDITQFSLRKPSGETALVLFAAINERLESVPTREGWGAAQTFMSKLQKAVAATDNMDVIAQYQILVSAGRPLDRNELADVHRHLNLVRARLVDHVQAAEGASR